VISAILQVIDLLRKIVEGATDDELAHVQLESVRQLYGYPHMVGHRSSLAGSLFEGCKLEKHIEFLFGTSATEIDLSSSSKPSFLATNRKTNESERIQADILLGCDGIKSNTRAAILNLLGADAKVVDTNQAAYRIMLKREDMAHDPELLALLDSDAVIRWIGEKRHIIAYAVANKSIYNLSTAQPDTHFAAAPSATYTTRGSKAAMLEVYSDFCPKVQKMLNLVPEGEVCEWKLRVHAPLPTWFHGTTALVGDACHPTLPHLAQGAAQAIEDAAVIGVVLSNLPDTAPETINKALQAYEDVRKVRAETLVDLAAASGRALHLGEGAAKEERDRAFAAVREKGGTVPDKWADADVQKMIYGFDCMEAAQDRVAKLFGDLTAR
jgi:salicylate hydroxylase